MPLVCTGLADSAGNVSLLAVSVVTNVHVINVNNSRTFTMPSGGTWRYFIACTTDIENSPTYSRMTADEVSGGAMITLPGSDSKYARGIAIRIA